MNSEYLVGRLETAVKQLQQAKSAFKSGQAPRGVMLMLDGLGNAEVVLEGARDNGLLEVGDMTLKPSGGVLDVYRDGSFVGDITAQGLYEAADMTDNQLSEAWVVSEGESDE